MRQLLVLFLCRCPATGTVAGIFWQLDTVEAHPNKTFPQGIDMLTRTRFGDEGHLRFWDL